MGLRKAEAPSKFVNPSVCPDCKCDRVHPDHWADLNNGDWKLELWCPDCYQSWEAIHTQTEVERFDSDLDSAASKIIGEIRELSEDCFRDYGNAFIEALRADAILPEDF